MPRFRARDPKREYEPTHARAAQRRIAAAVIACTAILVIAGAVIYAILRYPNLGVHKPASVPAIDCRYYSADVTVDITGGTDCVQAMQPLVNAVGGVWRGTSALSGTQYASYRSGARTARLYDKDGTDTPLAARVAAYFRMHGWA